MAQAPANPATLPPLPPGERLIATLAVSLAVFMYGLDLAVANVSIPAIAGDLGGSLSQGTWVITSYAVANAIFIPLTGWLTTRIGQVRLFVWSVFLFTLTSGLCGLATSMEMLVVFRALQGAVSGPMNPLAMALLLQAYPANKASVAMAASMMTAMLSPALGPILGGWITDNMSWPWIFYINIPFGLFTTWASWRLFRSRESQRQKLPVDYVGLVLLVVWVGALQIMLDLGRENGWFDSSLVIGLAIVAAIGFVFFVIWEWYDAHPVVNLRLFTIPSFRTGIFIIGMVNVPFFGNIILTPLWLQGSLGYTATLSGGVVMAGGLAMFLLQPVIGKVVPRTGFRPIATCGLVLLIASAILRVGFTPSVARGDLVWPQILQGIGTAAVFMPIALYSLSSVPQWQIASATGMNSFVRTLTTGLGTSFATTLWDNRMTLHRTQLAEHIAPYNDIATQTLSGLDGLFSREGSLASLERLMVSQTQTMAFNDYSFASMLLFALCLCLLWVIKPPKAAPAVATPVADH